MYLVLLAGGHTTKPKNQVPSSLGQRRSDTGLRRVAASSLSPVGGGRLPHEWELVTHNMIS